MGLLVLRSSVDEIFPLEISANGRYLQDAQGTPFLITGDSGWMIPNQLTNAEIDTYLDAMEAVGVNGILVEGIGLYFTSQTPTYDNVDGEQPFTTMVSATNVDFASSLVAAFWNRVDYLVNEAKARSMVVLINPAYLGFAGGQEGWADALTAESDADLGTYGTRLGQRYTQGNIIWIAGGDYDGGDGSQSQQQEIFDALLAEQPNALVMPHGPPNTSGFTDYSTFSGFNVNTLYAYPDEGTYPYVQAATEYARAGPIPLFYFEGRYEQEDGFSAAIGRLQMYTPVLSGALVGFLIGNNPRWHFESPNTLFAYEGTWEDSLTSTLTTELEHARALFTAYEWWKLEPKTDTSLVSSSLSSNLTRLTPALASDGTFAMIYVPSSQTVTVVTDALTGVAGNVRIRLYNPTDGTYTVNQASIAKSSGQSVATGGERIIVVDAA